MDPSIRKLYQIFEQNKGFGSDESINPGQMKIQDLLYNVFAPGPSFYFIFDFTRFEFDFVSDPVSKILEVQTEDFNIQSFIERIHPEDREYFAKCVDTILHFLFRKITLEDLPHYKASFQYRLEGKSGYRLFLHQALPITIDQQGLLSKFLGSISDIHHITRYNNRKLSMIGLKGRPSFYNVRSIDEYERFKHFESNYSERELQILRLISEGISNEIIGAKLNISVGTVRTHRKNILAKSSATNSVQAVADAIRNNLI